MSEDKRRSVTVFVDRPPFKMVSRVLAAHSPTRLMSAGVSVCRSVTGTPFVFANEP